MYSQGEMVDESYPGAKATGGATMGQSRARVSEDGVRLLQ